jgi:hypothetical protein
VYHVHEMFGLQEFAGIDAQVRVSFESKRTQEHSALHSSVMHATQECGSMISTNEVGVARSHAFRLEKIGKKSILTTFLSRMRTA